MKILSIALCMVSLLGASLGAQDIILLNQDGEEVGVAKDVEQKKAAAMPGVETPPVKAPAKESTSIKDGVITVLGPDGEVQEFKLSEARSVSISRSSRTVIGPDGIPVTENKSTATLIGPDGVRREIEMDADGATGKVVSETKVPKSWMIGVSSQPASPILRSQLQLDDDIGLVVKRVLDGGAGKEAGLKANDLILFANQKPIATTKQLTKIVNEAGAEGSEVSLTVLRGGEEVSVSVTPVEREGAQLQIFAGGLDPGIDFGGLDMPNLFPGDIMLDKHFGARQLPRNMQEQMDERVRRIQEEMEALRGQIEGGDLGR